MINNISNWLFNRASESTFKEFLKDSLVDLCLIETIPSGNIPTTIWNEQRALNFIRDLLKQYVPGSVVEEKLIRENIREDLSFTPPYYADDSNIYERRSNLICTLFPDIRSKSGKSMGLNAHIDTVAPFIKPFVYGDIVYGRGACDDKGSCLNIIAALRLLDEAGTAFGIYPGKKVVSMFVIDEETGGNGSLSLALDNELMNGIDSMVVLEPTNQQIHPANRGALWYKVELNVIDMTSSIRELLEIVISLEEAGRKLLSNSDHELFPDKPVQTCQGIFGPYGEHPSRICDRIEFLFKSNFSLTKIENLIKEGLNEYIIKYGIRDVEISGYYLEKEKENYKLIVPGSSSHMGASLYLDNAIVKASYIMKKIYERDSSLKVNFPDYNDMQTLVLEGGQGFLPDYTIEEVKKILSDAVVEAESGLKNVIVEFFSTPVISFDKLHNNSFSGNPGSELVQNALFSARKVGIKVNIPLTGFPVSCDARLFANISGKETLTIGPGKIEDAHSNREKLDINDLASSSAFLALFILIQTGAIKSTDYS